jgi:Asparagine synthase
VSLTPLEVAAGVLLGEDPTTPRLPPVARDETPLGAIEGALRPALERPPCFVAFSGGRDSSAILAAATRLARREGLPLPIPATNRFRDAAGADEREWQETVVAHLGLADWLRLEWSDELDLIGPVAAPLLSRHGLLYPCNAHFVAPLCENAHGGSVVTGLGGDELFGRGRWLWAWSALRAGRDTRTLRRAAFALAPRALRRRLFLSRRAAPLPWLTPDARDAVTRAWAEQVAGEPILSSHRFYWSHRRRYLRLSIATLALIACDVDVLLVHPLADARLASTLARAPSTLRSTDRTDGLLAIFGPLVPEDVLRRATKASFDHVFFRRHSRSFAEQWSGDGIDPALVDAEALRAEWASPQPSAQSFTLLQATWLRLGGAGSGASELGEQVAGRTGE